jgi:hypothetical protein
LCVDFERAEVDGVVNAVAPVTVASIIDRYGRYRVARSVYCWSWSHGPFGTGDGFGKGGFAGDGGSAVDCVWTSKPCCECWIAHVLKGQVLVELGTRNKRIYYTFKNHFEFIILNKVF